VAFSPDGRFALSGSSDNTLKLWEVVTGREITTIKGHAKPVRSVAFSPDGRLVLSGSEDKTLKLWEVATGQEIRAFKGHSGAVWSVAFSPDGRLALSGSEDHTLKLWETATGREIRTFRRHSDGVGSATFSPDGRFTLSGSKDKTLKLWETATGREIRTFRGHSDAVWSVGFSPDGLFALSASWDKTLKLWEIATGQAIHTFMGHSESVRSVAFSPDGRFALSGSWDETLKLWKVATGQEIRTFGGYPNTFSSVAFSPDGRFILSANNDKTIRLWDTKTGQEIRIFKGYTDAVDVAFSPDGQFALSGADNTLKLWEVATGREIRIFRRQFSSIAFSPDGRLVLSGGSRLVVSSTGDGGLALSGANNTLKLWEVATGREVRTFKGHSELVRSVALSPDGRFALSGSWDKTLKLWEVATGREIRTLSGHSDMVLSVAFAPDGRLALSGSEDKTLKLWEVATGREIRTLRGHSDTVFSVAFSPDGRLALSGSKDKTLKLWDVATGLEIRTLRGHSDMVLSVAFSPDGRLALSSSSISIRLWDTQSGQWIVQMISTPDGEWIVNTPDGYYSTSPEGKSDVHYASATETYSFEQFESLFRRPDIIRARLAGDLKAGTPAPKLTRPPRVRSIQERGLPNTNRASYPLSVTTSSDDDVVKTVRVFVNGKPTVEVPVDAKEKRLNLDVPLFAGPNRITTVAYDSKGFSSNQESVDVVSTVPGAQKPKLWVLSVGVSSYPKLAAQWQLDYAHSDANALVKTLREQRGKLFEDVRDLTLTNLAATPKAIEDGLTALEAMDANDVAVVFMAGHGVQGKDGRFWFVTPEGSFEHPETGGVDWKTLGEHLAHIKGRVVLLLDACHSGSIVDETVVPNDELAARFFKGGLGGVMVFSASKGRQSSLESPDIGGGFGAFTYALTQGLGAKAKEADRDGNGFVEFMELVDYVGKSVNTTTKGEQTPWLSRKELFGDLAIAVSRPGS